MTDFLHEKVPAEGSCVVCDSSECPAAGGNAILCQNRIPMLLEHGIRWMVVERAKMFNAFIPSIGGTIQLNSGDLGEGIAAIFSGDPGGGIGGHGPGPPGGRRAVFRRVTAICCRASRPCGRGGAAWPA